MVSMTRYGTTYRRFWFLLGGALLIAAAIAVSFVLVGELTRLVFLAFLPLPIWGVHRWRERAERARTRREIAKRLRRLPDDFIVLQNLEIPAPWGRCRVPYIILSRFGLVLAGDPCSPSTLEQAEAVRSFLFARGLLRPKIPIQSLVLLPPGRDSIMADARSVRVDRLSLEHLAPGSQPLLDTARIQAVVRALIQPQWPAGDHRSA